MLKHTFLIIYRNFKRSKGTFIINLIGLSTGLAAALFIYLWVNDELSIDGFHEKDERLFQVMTNHHNADGILTMDPTPDLLAPTLAEEMPEVEYAAGATPSSWFGNFVLSTSEANAKAMGQFVGKDYFKMFSFPILQGDPDRVLRDKNSIVISDELAIRLFGKTENVIGKTLRWKLIHYGHDVMVSGIFKKLPSNATEEFDFVLSYDSWLDPATFGPRNINWGNFNPSTYVLVKEGTDVGEFAAKLEGFVKTKQKDSNITLLLQRYSEKYLNSHYENGKVAGGRIQYVNLFSIIAIFILIIACINFMNLSTAKATRRIKEVGIKKAVGAKRWTLAFQYLSESLIMAFLALGIAVLLVDLLVPQFNLIVGKDLDITVDKNIIAVFIALTLVTGIVSGSYPALYLSGFNPAAILKGKLNASFGELWARKGLVVFQFILSILFIVSVVVVYHQIEMIQSKNAGFNRENVIYFQKEGKVAEKDETFLEEINKIPGVTRASSISSSIINNLGFTTGISWEGKNPDDNIKFATNVVNYGMIETLGIELAAGRTFSNEHPADSTKLIFNETAIKTMGLKDPVGQVVNMWGNKMEIIGVVKDFHFQSLHEQVTPFVFRLGKRNAYTIMVRIDAGKERETLRRLEEFHSKFNPGFSFDYKFLDADYAAQYVSETRVGILSKYFAGLAIIISCLGLFGLAAFTAERRLKEIGIRKVLGSSELGIILLLSGDFTKMVVVANLIALPLSYLVSKQWLDNFAYKIDLQWWYFLGGGVAALLIAWTTVGLQTFKAAKINPTLCLKDE